MKLRERIKFTTYKSMTGYASQFMHQFIFRMFRKRSIRDRTTNGNIYVINHQII